MYLIAFILELWCIISSDGMILAPSHVLCVGYSLVFVSAAFLLHGLTVKKTRYLLVWLFTIVVFIVPEAGLVIFMIFYYWNFSTLHGLLVIFYWILRTILNYHMYSFSVSNLEREKQLSQSQQDLNLAPNVHNGENIEKPSENNSRNESLQNSAYINFGFMDSDQNLNIPHQWDDSPFLDLQRSQSEYQLVHSATLQRYGSLPSRMPNRCDNQILPLGRLYKTFQEPNQFIAACSQFDASRFDGMFERVRFAQNTLPRPFFSKRNGEHIPFGRTQSLYDLRGDYAKMLRNSFSKDSLSKSLDKDVNVGMNEMKRASSLQDLNYCGVSPYISRRQDFFLNSVNDLGIRSHANLFRTQGYLGFSVHSIPSLTDCTDNTDEYHDVAL